MKRTFKSAIAFILTLTLLMTALIFAPATTVSAETGYDRGYTGSFPGTGKIVAQGLDVSSWQGSSLDFQNFKNAGYDYVILRCGTSKGKDTCFESYYTKARNAGLDIGCYYYSYATTVAAAKTDLANIKSWIAGKKFEYPVYYDYEDSSQQSLGATMATNVCRTVMDGLRDAGYLVGFYSMKSWITQSWITSSGIKSTYEGWVAHYVSGTSDGGYSTYSPTYCTQYGMYQYTSNKYVNGKGPFDANVCYKDYPSIVKQYGFNGYVADTKFTFKFMPNGGTGTMENQNIERGVTTAISKNQFTREGYTFAGWRANRTNSNTWRYTNGTDSAWYEKGQQPAGYYFYVYKDGQSVSKTGALGETVKMYAVWTKQDYTIKYFANGGTGEMTDSKHTYGLYSCLSPNTFTRSGYTFAGWHVYRPNTGEWLYSDGSEKTGYLPGTQPELYSIAVYVDQQNITSVCAKDTEVYCYAQWVPASTGTTTYYIDYNANGGEGTMERQAITYGTSTKITPNAFTREGYSFAGWRVHRRNDNKWVFKNSSDSDKWLTPTEYAAATAGEYRFKVYKDNSSVSKTSSVDTDIVTFFAQWEIESYEVKFVDYDGTVLSTQTVEYGSAATAPSAPSRAEYSFTGWDTEYDVIKGDTTITATYASISAGYTVIFVDYNGTVLSIQTVKEGESATAPSAPSRAADVNYIYSFNGWDKSYTNITADTTVTAVYSKTPQVYYLRATFNNWGTEDVMTSNGDGTYTISVALDEGSYEYKAANSDWTMEWPLGINNVLELDSKSYVTFVLNTNNHTLTAKREALECTVTFVDYDGTVISTQKVEKGGAAVPPATPTREGYSFAGWDKPFTNITEDTTITAKYTEVITAVGKLSIQVVGGTGFTLSFNDGAARPQSSFYLNSKLDVGTKVTVTAQNSAGREFIGWIDQSNNKILTTNITYSFYTGGNDALRALFKDELEQVNMVMYKNDKSSQILDMQYYAVGDTITVPDDTMFPGYDFVDWSLTVAQIQAKLESGEDVYVVPTWSVRQVYVAVDVTNGTVTGHGGMNAEGKYLAAKYTTVVADAAASGMKFAYWADASGKVKSYDATYSFYPAVDTALTAVYVGENETINYQILANMDACDTSGAYGTFYMSWYVPEGYTFMGSGLVAANKDNYKEDTFYHGTTDSNVWDRASSGTSANGTFTWTGPVMSGQTWYAKAWVQYADAQGNTVVVYSDMFEVTKL